jgi:hypothetical protein
MNRKQRDANRHNAWKLRQVRMMRFGEEVRAAVGKGQEIPIEYRLQGVRECMNCGEILTGDGHFAPPSAGMPGRFMCKRPAPSAFVAEVEKTFDEMLEEDEELWDADPNCKHNVVAQRGGGIKCTKCPGWFCF